MMAVMVFHADYSRLWVIRLNNTSSEIFRPKMGGVIHIVVAHGVITHYGLHLLAGHLCFRELKAAVRPHLEVSSSIIPFI